MTELEAKVYVSQVRTFYEDLLYYGAVNAILILIWLFLSASWYFWPGWVILGWGAVLLRRALSLKIFSLNKLGKCLPCFNSEWEERQLKKLTAEKLGLEDNSASSAEGKSRKSR